MKLMTCVIVFILFSTILYAQNGIPQLLDKLHTAKADSARVNAYSDIFQYYQYSNPDSAIYYAQQGLSYFTGKEFKLGIARMTSMLASTDIAQGRIELAKKRENEALKIYTELNYKDGIGSTNNGLGIIEGKSGNYNDATRHFMIALKAFESTGNKSGIQATYMKLGVVNERTNNIDKAIDYYNKSMEMAKATSDSNNLLMLYNNMGIIYGKRGDWKKAMEYFETAMKQSRTPKLTGMHIMSLMNMGIVYDNTGDKKKAMENYELALNLAGEKNYPEEYARVTVNIAALIDKTEPERAMALLKNALDIVRRINQRSLQAEILDGMISISKDQGDYKEAIALGEQYMVLRDSMFSIDKAKEIANLQSMYELDKSNEKVKQLTEAERKTTLQKNIIIVVACFLAVSLISLMFFYRKSQSLNIQLAKRESELSKANTVKDKLFSIIGHDLRGPIANAPQMIDIYRESTTTEEEKKFLLDSLMENATASFETLDKLLHWGHSQIKGEGIKRSVFNANENVQHIIRLMKSIANQKRISITNNLPVNSPVYADPTHFDFIMRNLLSNAIKFTHTDGSVTIAADKKMRPGYLVFSVADNGIGMDEEQLANVFEPFGPSTAGTANELGTSIGLMLCMQFITENGGDMWAESEEGEGSTFYFALLASA